MRWAVLHARLLIKSYKYEHQNGGTMRRQKWGVIGLAAMLGIAALGCGEKKTEQDNGMDNPATVINWQEETKDAPDAVQGQETLPPELQKLEKWEFMKNWWPAA